MQVRKLLMWGLNAYKRRQPLWQIIAILVTVVIGYVAPLASCTLVTNLRHAHMAGASRHLSFPLAQGSMLGLGPLKQRHRMPMDG